MRLVLATRSRGKLIELRAMLTPHGYDVVDLDAVGVPEQADEAGVECHDTFEDNARAKARYFLARAGGAPVIADDSGLEVAALGGLPGVRSKRWSGREDLEGAALDRANNAKLLAALPPGADRSARFVSVVVFATAAGAEHIARGEVAGTILTEPRGEHGFGYDPYFFSPELGRTLAEASPAEKSTVSHRGRAVHALLARLSSPGGVGH